MSLVLNNWALIGSLRVKVYGYTTMLFFAETFSVTSCLLPRTMKPFQKGVHSCQKEFFSLRADPPSEKGCNHKNSRVASNESVSVHLKLPMKCSMTNYVNTEDSDQNL